MAGNSIGKAFRITTWGESHGAAVGVVVDGCPAGLELSEEEIQWELDKRAPGRSELATARREEDRVIILSGVFEGRTLGTPISMLVWNKDVDSSPYEALKSVARLGHADLPYFLKYGHRDWRGGGRASARETTARVAAGAIAKKLIKTHDIEVVAHVIEVGGVRARSEELSFGEIKRNVEHNDVRCADLEAAEEMRRVILKAKKEGDSIGGVVEVIAWNVPPGLGEPVFDKLDADLAKALMSIGAVKGVEIGVGFEAARLRGSEMNDEFYVERSSDVRTKDITIKARTNRAGGILGGISTGMPIVCRIAVKPTPSIRKRQRSVDFVRLEDVSLEIRGRHDPCICPRIAPVAEAMVAIVLADHLLRNRLARV